MTCSTCRHATAHPMAVITHLVCAHPRAYRPHGVLPATEATRRDDCRGEWWARR